jgi:hypothetical protein
VAYGGWKPTPTWVVPPTASSPAACAVRQRRGERHVRRRVRRVLRGHRLDDLRLRGRARADDDLVAGVEPGPRGEADLRRPAAAGWLSEVGPKMSAPVSNE